MIQKALLALIHWYWRVVREEDRRVCLFRVSCSKHVHSTITSHGWIPGIRSFLFRMKTCKPGYRVEHKNGEILILTVNGKHIPESDLNPLLLKEIKATC